MANQLFFLSLADIFSIYPKIFKQLVSTRSKPSIIFLPSDAEWQERMYYRLLELQKRVNEAIESGMGHSHESSQPTNSLGLTQAHNDINEIEEISTQKERHLFNHLDEVRRVSPSITPNGLRFENRKKCRAIRYKLVANAEHSWSLEYIAKAAKLLSKPRNVVHFDNEHEMRKVYSLIYDVFRYKSVLSNALEDVSFYVQFPEYKDNENRVWLMLYDLYDRRFKQRYAEEIEAQTRLYQDANVADVAGNLWKFRKCLAASISRTRIKCKALTLSQILPIHLRNEKVAIAASNPVVTGWINPFLLRDKSAATQYLSQMGFTEHSDSGDSDELDINHYKWDNVCPLFISCIPADRGEFTKSKLMTNHIFIMQDKAFSYGPAIMSRLLDLFELSGDILQTHVESPRSTAYLAALFYSVNRVNNFYVYGAGTNLKEYRNYMDTLGVTNIRIFAEPFVSFGLESKRFGLVVGIFANPANSFSAISDPIDLICSRGGDLSMLEVLTESEISEEGKRRVSLILEEQLFTLQMAMSRPQVQFVLYQTHSIVKTENQHMVRYVIKLINETSLRKHETAFRERKRLEAMAEAEAANIPSAALNVGSPRKRSTKASEEKNKTQTSEEFATLKLESSIAPDTNTDGSLGKEKVELPDIDEFVTQDVPDICSNQDNCLNVQAVGCFLSLIKRKQITQLNAQYLIKMAEIRGLFGKPDTSKNVRSKIVRVQETNADTLTSLDLENNLNPNNHVNIENVMKRLMKETNASFNRINSSRMSAQNKPFKYNSQARECLRYKPTSFNIRQTWHNARSLWRYAINCVGTANVLKSTWCWHTMRNSCVSKSRKQYRHLHRRPLRLHVNNIKLSLSKLTIH